MWPMYNGNSPFCEANVHKGICSYLTKKTILFRFSFRINFLFKVCTEGRLLLEFVYDDYMRIKSWHMAVRNHRELIPKSVIGIHSHPQPDPNLLDQMSKNITRQGITSSTLNYLRVSDNILDQLVYEHSIGTFEGICKLNLKIHSFKIMFPSILDRQKRKKLSETFWCAKFDFIIKFCTFWRYISMEYGFFHVIYMNTS